ncbi:hypothetical protein AB1399_01590, partial [Hydrogenibacillus schlegelii]|uniref:hypothetical protein n=1 Tax=Hydrogenibacillus schlegelii TaxID=1484 RepID=UPI0034A04A89
MVRLRAVLEYAADEAQGAAAVEAAVGEAEAAFGRAAVGAPGVPLFAAGGENLERTASDPADPAVQVERPGAGDPVAVGEISRDEAVDQGEGEHQPRRRPAGRRASGRRGWRAGLKAGCPVGVAGGG